jgi:hypothetical protein
MPLPVTLRQSIATVLAVALASSAGALPALGQEVASEGASTELICVAIGRRWNGSEAERNRIEQVPVPQSFLNSIRSSGCGRWQLILGSFLDWHIRHGSEQSALAAVRFLEIELSADLGADFPEDFAADWQRGARDTLSLLERRRRQNPGTSDIDLLRDARQDLAARDVFKELRAQAQRLENAEFIAGEYTRAAEHWGSRALWNEARRVHDPAMEMMSFIEERQRLGGVDAFLADELRPGFRSDRMSPQMRDISLAVTHAFIARTNEAALAAHGLAQQYYRPDGRSHPYPDLLTFISEAYESDNEACNANERNSLEGYEDRCEENGFEQFALGFWYQRSRIELLSQQIGQPLDLLDRPFARDGVTPSVIDLFVRRAWHEGMRYGDEPAPPEAVRLLILLAQTKAVALRAACVAGGGNEENLMYEVLQPISRAQALASPSLQTELYREVAQARVHLQEILEPCEVAFIERRFERDLILARSFLDQYATLPVGY